MLKGPYGEKPMTLAHLPDVKRSGTLLAGNNLFVQTVGPFIRLPSSVSLSSPDSHFERKSKPPTKPKHLIDVSSNLKPMF